MCENMCVHTYMCVCVGEGGSMGVCVCVHASVCVHACTCTWHGCVSQGYWGSGKRGKRELTNEMVKQKREEIICVFFLRPVNRDDYIRVKVRGRERDLTQKTNDW